MTVHVVRISDGAVVCSSCLVADTFRSRLRGLLGRSSLPARSGVLLRPSGSVHMFFMRFAIDAVFLDRDLVVLDIVPGLRPWHVAGRRGARAVLELAEGEASRVGLGAGDRLHVVGE